MDGQRGGSGDGDRSGADVLVVRNTDRPRPDGGHVNRAYSCRHPLLGWLPHTAQPRPRRLLPRTGRRSI